MHLLAATPGQIADGSEAVDLGQTPAEIVVLSAEQVEMVRRSYHREAVVLGVGAAEHFFDPPDRRAARARLGIPDDVFLVVGSGILVEHRRFEDLIEAMSLVETDRSIHALITGSDHVDGAYADRLAALISSVANADLSPRLATLFQPRRIGKLLWGPSLISNLDMSGSYK